MKKCLRAGLQPIAPEDVQCAEDSNESPGAYLLTNPSNGKTESTSGRKIDVDQPAWIFGLRDRKLSHYFQGFINRVSTVCQASEKGILMLELT